MSNTMFGYPLKGLSGRVDTEISAKPSINFVINPILISNGLNGDEYYFIFNNMCFDNSPRRGILKVDHNILKSKLQSWIKPSDRAYIKLESFDNTKSRFSFCIDDWLKDGLKNCKPYDNFLSMSRSYKLGRQLPQMVLLYGTEMTYGKYIAEHFKKMLKQSNQLRSNVFGIIEEISKKHLNLDSLNLFDYRYDKVSNSVIVSVKPIYVASLTAAATIMAKDDSWKKKVNFDKTVGMFLKFKS